MRVTIKDIAKEANVTIGTVDRVLHNRKGVSLKTKEKILKIIKKYNYKPNNIARALKNSSKIRNIAVIILDSKVNIFSSELYNGIKDRLDSLESYGIKIKWFFLSTFKVSEQLEVLKNIDKKDFEAIIIRPINDIKIKLELEKLINEGVKICTVLSDIDGINSGIYKVKNNSMKEGKYIASIITKMIEKPDIAIITGSKLYRNHEMKIYGIEEYLKNNFDKYNLKIYDAHDKLDIESIKLENPNAIIIQSLDKEGIENIYDKFKDIKICAFGTKEDLDETINNKKLTFALDEQPYLQGDLSMQLIFEALFYGKEETIIEVETPLIINM